MLTNSYKYKVFNIYLLNSLKLMWSKMPYKSIQSKIGCSIYYYLCTLHRSNEVCKASIYRPKWTDRQR